METCNTTCRNFTVREDLEYTFNGKQRLIITSSDALENLNCKQYSLKVSITGIKEKYKLDSFEKVNYYCSKILYYDNITNFFEEYYTKNFQNTIKLNETLDSPALIIRPGLGLLYSKIEIKIDGMSSANSFQIRSKNTKAVDGKLIEQTHYSVIYKANASMF